MKVTKSYFPLIVPDRLNQNLPFIHVLYLEKCPKGVKFKESDLTSSTLRFLDERVSHTLKTHTDNGFFYFIQELEKKHRTSKSGIPQDIYVSRAISRHFTEISESFFEVYSEEKIYHKIADSKERFLIRACSVSVHKPQLKFEVVKNNLEELFVRPYFEVYGEKVSEDNVQRFRFLLLVNDTYYLLDIKDYLALENLYSKKPKQYARQPDKLMEKIILPLEEKYEVNKHDFFSVNVIDTIPQCTVLLSEISNTFLMITPRWDYDGFVVEGNFQERHATHTNGVLYEIMRNEEEEDRFVEYLKNRHPSFARQRNGYFYLSFADAKKKQWFLKTYHQWLEDNIEIQGMDMLHHFRYSQFSISTQMELLEQKDSLLQIYMKVSFGQEEVPLKELKKLLSSGQSYVLLKDDSMGVLTEDWIHDYGTFIRHGQIHDSVISIPKWILLALRHSSGAAELNLSISKEWWEKWAQWQDAESEVVPVSEKINAELRPYQRKGYEWMCLLSEIGAGALLADDMGLGKTLQTIAFMTYLLEQNETARFIVVCPASLIYNWGKEIEHFSKNLKPFVYQSSNRDLQEFTDSGCHVLITSYGMLRSDIDELSVIMWETAVLDESHNIKNSNALITKAIQFIQARTKVALSGTPVMNHTEELYSQVNFLLPEYLGPKEFFRKEYALPIDRSRDRKKMQALQKLINPFVLRRTKSQVAKELPEKIESVYWCEMGEEQKLFYDEFKKSIRNSIYLGIRNEGIQKSKLSILQGIIKLRQVCASPVLVKDAESTTFKSVKLDMLMEELTELQGHKALVFSQFLGMLDLVEKRCDAEGILYYRIDGSVDKKRRAELVSSFQEEDNPVQVFLMSMGAGSVGLTLTAADYVFLMDPWWNTALQQQAIDRTHRIGQTKNVFAYKMICRDTIEEKILKLQESKKELSEELVGAEEGFVKQLTEDDIDFLFE